MPDVHPRVDIDRLADALLALADATGLRERFTDDLAAVNDLLDGNASVCRFLADATVAPEGKAGALEALLDGHVHASLRRFLQLVAAEGAGTRLRELAAAFFGKAAASRRQTAGEIVTARPLSAGQVAEIEQHVGRILGKQVALHVKIDEGLLGGVLLRVGDFVLDGTLDARLDGMRRQLMA